MDDLNPFNKSSRAMEGSQMDNEDSFQDKPEESGENPAAVENPVLPSLRQDASLNQQSPSSISAETSTLSAVPIFAPSSQYLNIDQFDETRQEPPNPSSKNPNVEAGIGPTSAKRRRSETSECDSDESKTKNESFVSTLPPSEAARTQNKPQIMRKARKTVGSARKSKASESPKMSPTSSNKKRRTMGSSSSDSNDSPPEETLEGEGEDVEGEGEEVEEEVEEEEGSYKSGSDAASQTSEPNVESVSEWEESAEFPSLERIRRELVEEISRSIHSTEIQDAEVPMEEDQSGPLLEGQHSESVSSKPSTSGERSRVGKNQEPPYLDAHEGRPSTSSGQPVIQGGSSAGNRFSLSGVNRRHQNLSLQIEVPANVRMAQAVSFAALTDVMTSNKEEDWCNKIKEPLLLVHDNPCPENEMLVTTELLLYLTEREVVLERTKFTFGENTLKYHNEYAYNVLIRILVEVIINSVLVLSSKDFEKIMISYHSFAMVYENFSKIKKEYPGIKLNKSYGERMNSIDMLLLQMKNAFQLLLLHIGEHADQESKNRYVKEVLEEHKKYLTRRIG